MRNKYVKLGIFDIDGTIFRSSLGVELIHYLVEKKIFPEAAWDEIEKDYYAWLNRQGSFEKYVRQLVDVFIKYLPGHNEKDLIAIASKILSKQKGHLYRYTRDLVKKLKNENFTLIAISGSPNFIVNEFASFLNFDIALGTELQVIKGKFTGVAKSGDADKLEVLKNIVQLNKLKIDWKNSIAVGDTSNDIPMLKAVGKPIAFNPNVELLKHASKMKWKIIVERKDVIYELKKFDLIKIN